MGSQESNISSGGKLRLWSDCVDVQTELNLRNTHMPTFILYWIPAQFDLGGYFEFLEFELTLSFKNIHAKLQRLWMII